MVFCIPSVYGKGENVRDWLYVEDHCRAIDLIIHKGTVGEVYNIGGHNEMNLWFSVFRPRTWFRGASRARYVSWSGQWRSAYRVPCGVIYHLTDPTFSLRKQLRFTLQVPIPLQRQARIYWFRRITERSVCL